MSGYAKLFSSILHSTIWLEENHVRLVWITMLAMANRKGVVEASLPGLAVAARVSMDECQEALDRFLAPDPHSRTKDHDGRRVAKVDGGWVLLNYEKHREAQSRSAKSERQARWRAKRDREKVSTERLTVDGGDAEAVAGASTTGSASASGSDQGESEGGVDDTGPGPSRLDGSGRPIPRKPAFPEMVRRERYEPSAEMLNWARTIGLDDRELESVSRDVRNKFGLRPNTWDFWDDRWMRFAEAAARPRCGVSGGAPDSLPEGLEVVSGGRS